MQPSTRTNIELRPYTAAELVAVVFARALLSTDIDELHLFQDAEMHA